MPAAAADKSPGCEQACSAARLPDAHGTEGVRCTMVLTFVYTGDLEQEQGIALVQAEVLSCLLLQGGYYTSNSITGPVSNSPEQGSPAYLQQFVW